MLLLPLPLPLSLLLPLTRLMPLPLISLLALSFISSVTSMLALRLVEELSISKERVLLIIRGCTHDI